MTERYVCIHGHFYQPPRENPWLEEVERQESAAPFHDWNERVCREAYAPNAFSRILDDQGRIARIVNNYARISFNFGPTLLSWMERKAPRTYEAILAADRESRNRFSGHGSAMAQAHGHLIMPLASSRDKRTQIRWGIRDFEHRFGRSPEGMWLPETAVDLETLELMVDEGIGFTVLAPRQAQAVRRGGDGDWIEVEGEGVDPRRPYRVVLPSGGEIAVFFYDGSLARAVAFEDVLVEGGVLARRILEAGAGASGPGGLTHLATDGETYGHHHRHGEMALSFALAMLERAEGVRITNYGEYLERHPPEWEVRIRQATSWSCAHGVERWRADCGCSTGQHTEWRQAWRRPLRDALDWLRDELVPRFEAGAADVLTDPWGARDRYIDVILDRSPGSVDGFLDREMPPETPNEGRSRALKLLELQRHAMLMFTSCGWFFDDLARIETLQVLRYAARALHLAEILFGADLEDRFGRRLAAARSNVPALGTGEELYRRRIAPERVGLAKVAAHHAVASLFEGGASETGGEGEASAGTRRVYAYEVRVEDEERLEADGTRLAVGRLRIESRITRAAGRFGYAVVHRGEHHLTGGVRPYTDPGEHRRLATELLDGVRQGRRNAVVRLLDRKFRASAYSLHSLFPEERERVMAQVLQRPVAEAEEALSRILRGRLPLMRFLAGLGLAQPRAFRAAGEFLLSVRLERALQAHPPDLQQARTLVQDVRTTGIRVDREAVQMAAAEAVERVIGDVERALRDEAETARGADALAVAVDLVRFVRTLPFAVDLWGAQNTFFRILQREGLASTVLRSRDEPGERADSKDRRWNRSLEPLRTLGDGLGLAVHPPTERSAGG